MTAGSNAAGPLTGAHAPLVLLAAVDVARGQVVQPTAAHGSSAGASADPVDAALRWQSAGADWLHLVDIDTAFGHGSNGDILREVVGRLDIDVEVSGGIHDDASLEAALATGCRRVVLGTEALESPAWCADVMSRHDDRVAIALDVRGRRTLAPRGGYRDGSELAPALDWLEENGCRRCIVTDVDREGGLEGPDVELLRLVCAGVSAPVVASGGVSTLTDVSRLAALVPVGVEGAVIGTALYTGALDLGDAARLVRAGDHRVRR